MLSGGASEEQATPSGRGGRLTGRITTWIAEPEAVADSFHRIDKSYPGRFLLGIGVGHPEALTQYRKPIEAEKLCPILRLCWSD